MSGSRLVLIIFLLHTTYAADHTSSCKAVAKKPNTPGAVCPIFQSCCFTECEQSCSNDCSAKALFRCSSNQGHLDLSKTYCHCGEPIVDVTSKCTNSTNHATAAPTTNVCTKFDACCEHQPECTGANCRSQCLASMIAECQVHNGNFVGDTQCTCGTVPPSFAPVPVTPGGSAPSKKLATGWIILIVVACIIAAPLVYCCVRIMC